MPEIEIEITIGAASSSFTISEEKVAELQPALEALEPKEAGVSWPVYLGLTIKQLLKNRYRKGKFAAASDSVVVQELFPASVTDPIPD